MTLAHRGLKVKVIGQGQSQDAVCATLSEGNSSFNSIAVDVWLQGLMECSSSESEANEAELELWQDSRLMVCTSAACNSAF